ncbi:MAG: Fic family protein [Deltaproteobacteria bacterium]
MKLIADTAKRRDLSGDEAKALLTVVGEYNRALELLDDYDHRRVGSPPVSRTVVHPLEYDEALRIVEQIRSQFSESAVFGVEKDKGLASALGAIMQTAAGEDVYPSLEEKAAYLLYFMVKNHAFVEATKGSRRPFFSGSSNETMLSRQATVSPASQMPRWSPSPF